MVSIPNNEQEEYEWWEDVVAESHPSEWARGLRAISEAMGYSSVGKAVEVLTSKKLPSRKLRSPFVGSVAKFTWAAKLADIEAWKEEQKAKKQPVLLPIAPETKEEREVNLLKRMLKRQDEMEATMKALWDDIRALRSALGV